jgi:type II restriction enzyme
MPINSDKPHLWKTDVAASVDRFTTWFLQFAPKAYRDTRIETTKAVAASDRF